jgi:hypothetical protein
VFEIHLLSMHNFGKSAGFDIDALIDVAAAGEIFRGFFM